MQTFLPYPDRKVLIVILTLYYLYANQEKAIF